MAADAEDINGDGLPELFATHFANEYATLYQNLGKGTFMDSTPFFGLAADTMPWVEWGTALVDLDNDGWPDIFIANGHVDDNRDKLGQNIRVRPDPAPVRQRQGEAVPPGHPRRRPLLRSKHVGRGAAFGDLDNDGDIDIAINNKDGPAAILRNDTKNANHWIRLELQGTRSNRDGVGARVEVVAGGLNDPTASAKGDAAWSRRTTPPPGRSRAAGRSGQGDGPRWPSAVNDASST